MRNAYPVILTPDEVGYIVYVPDFDTSTQGEDIYDAIEMARDVIGLVSSKRTKVRATETAAKKVTVFPVKSAVFLLSLEPTA